MSARKWRRLKEFDEGKWLVYEAEAKKTESARMGALAETHLDYLYADSV